MLVILPDYSLHYIKFIIPFIIITPNAHTFAINNPVANVPNVYFTIKSVFILLLVFLFMFNLFIFLICLNIRTFLRFSKHFYIFLYPPITQSTIIIKYNVQHIVTNVNNVNNASNGLRLTSIYASLNNCINSFIMFYLYIQYKYTNPTSLLQIISQLLSINIYVGCSRLCGSRLLLINFL